MEAWRTFPRYYLAFPLPQGLDFGHFFFMCLAAFFLPTQHVGRRGKGFFLHRLLYVFSGRQDAFQNSSLFLIFSGGGGGGGAEPGSRGPRTSSLLLPSLDLPHPLILFRPYSSFLGFPSPSGFLKLGSGGGQADHYTTAVVLARNIPATVETFHHQPRHSKTTDRVSSGGAAFLVPTLAASNLPPVLRRFIGVHCL